jgi:hypothetical protein
MRLTTLGKIVVYGSLFATVFVIGLLTADWCWYGYCGL